MKTFYLFTIIAGVTIFSGNTLAVGVAGGGETLAECGEKSDSQARLACYDRLKDRQAAPPGGGADTADSSQPAMSGKKLGCGKRFTQVDHEYLDCHMDLSYITLLTGKRFGGDKTGTLLYEAQISERIHLDVFPENKRLSENLSKKLFLDLPFRMTIRQFTAESKPVKTPTYNPGFLLTYAPHDFPNPYYSVGVYHYSNGQDGGGRSETGIDGKPLPRSGVANTDNGSFNTNYIELAASLPMSSKPLKLNWAQIAFRQHAYGTFEKIQDDQYPRRELILKLQSTYPVWGGSKVGFRLTETLGMGYSYVIKPAAVPGPVEKARFSDRISGSLEMFALVPSVFNPFSIYLRYDHGRDYYNINFQKRINRLQFGLAASLL